MSTAEIAARHEIPTIKSRLIGFDFVLSHPSMNYLTTEAEKAHAFGERLGLGIEHLLTKTVQVREANRFTDRPFVDKFSIGIEAGVAGEERVVFAYVDDGEHSTSGFEAYIEQYRAPFARVLRFRVVYVSVGGEHFDTAERLFAERVASDRGRRPLDSEMLWLLGHFRDRAAYERKICRVSTSEG
jgi:hypothetical protein